MANIQERRDKNGKLISYSIRVHRGRDVEGKQLKPWTATFDVSPSWTEKSARKKAEAFAATFEKECRAGVTTDSRQKFAPYCEYVIAMKEQRGAKHSTIVRYKELTERIYSAIGHIKLKDLRADHLNSFYTSLGKPGQNKRTGSGLSAKTILEHHRLISTVLDQARKEGQVPFNVATKATLPKVVKKEVNYFQPEQIAAIRDALRREPLKWEMLTHLFLLTGARRGELLGLKWSAVDFEKNRIHICNNMRRIVESMRIPRKRPRLTAISRSRRRQCSFSAPIAHGRTPSGCGWANSMRIGALCSRRKTAAPCIQTA